MTPRLWGGRHAISYERLGEQLKSKTVPKEKHIVFFHNPEDNETMMMLSENDKTCV
jgi:hypothetical protein